MFQKRKFITWAMILMFLLSLYPNLKIAVNEVYFVLFANSYEVNIIYNASDQWNYKGHQLEIVEQPSPQLLIDGEQFPLLNLVEMTNSGTTSSLYQKYIRTSVYQEVTDKKTKQKRLAVVQRIQDQYRDTVSDDRYRIIWVEKGNIRTEEFSTDERRDPIYRAALISIVSPSPIGWIENLLYSWPGLGIPFLFPFATFAVSAIYLLLLIRKRLSPC
jgi:hypothetical protein